MSLNINGVAVDFPFVPYDCQVEYMKKVIQCLQESKNGILESPTGTGKTLCLLCSSLAWLASSKAQFSLRQCTTVSEENQFGNDLQSKLNSATGSDWSSPGMGVAVPKIIYASRTHSQLSQVMNELKRTQYGTGNRFKVGVLGSRDQLCINASVQSETSNTAKTNICRAKVKNRKCVYFNNFETKKSHTTAFHDKVVDIEDLVAIGQQHKCCPYYMAKEIKNDAEILFVPYNYILDPRARKAHGVELEGNVIIFDEAHNLEQICQDSASFDLTSYDLACGIEEMTLIIEKVFDLFEKEKAHDTYTSEDNTPLPDFNLEELMSVKSLLMELEKEIDNVEIKGDDGITMPGVFMFELMEKVKLTFQTKTAYLNLLENVVTYLNNEGNNFHTKGMALSKMADIIRTVFSRQLSGSESEPVDILKLKRELSKYFKVHIQEQTKTDKKSSTLDAWKKSDNKGSKDKDRILSYWCFSPGHSMKDLEAHGVKSIILTSGTLSPLKSFSAEMQIHFPITLENPHIIKHHQVMISAISCGPEGTALNSTYMNRFNPKYMKSLGNAIVNFSRITPNGLLIFFPSYLVMSKTLEYWQGDGIWKRITNYKDIFVEPKNKQDFQQTMNDFYEKINDSNLNGAIFIAVCRGKVSEGLDFSDINGRAVVITGLPYPPRMDAKVKLKMQFLDEVIGKQEFTGLTGGEWYRQQASRAVNQAIGRVIRHKDDYGAILLCDNRFKIPRTLQELPKWIQPHVAVHAKFGSVIKDLLQFFKTAEKEMPQPLPSNKKKKTQAGCVGAHFEPVYNASHSKSMTVQPASYVESHVRSLAPETDDLSFTTLKQQYESEESHISSTTKPAGLLDALHVTEDKRPRPSTNTHIPTSGCSTIVKSSTQTKKKISIIKKATTTNCKEKTAGTACSKQYSNHNITQNPVTTNIAKKQATANSGNTTVDKKRQYLEELKSSLNKDSYIVIFSKLRDYNKDGNFNEMLSGLVQFLGNDPKYHQLFRGFYMLIKPQHKEEFHKVSIDMTERGCGYKPEHSISRKRIIEAAGENSTKRQKMDTAEKSHGSSDACELCKEDINQLLQGPCLHICCFGCWKDHLKVKNCKDCPVCHKPMNRNELKKYAKVRVKCV